MYENNENNLNMSSASNSYEANTTNTNSNNCQSGNSIFYESAATTQNTNTSLSAPYHEYYYAAGNIQPSPTPSTSKKSKKTQKPFIKKVATVACLGVVFGAIAGTTFCVPTYMANKQLEQTKLEVEKLKEEYANLKNSTLTTTTDSLSAANTSFNEISTANITAIAQNCLPSVVSITNKGVTEVRTMFGTYQQDSESSGSGIIIGENDSELLIVTNYHVVSGSSELSVVFSYDEDSEEPSLVSAKVKGYEADKDLAVIAVPLDEITDEMRAQIKIATIGDSSNLVLGQEVVAIGNALGYGQSVTTGIISALNREVTVSDENGGTITNKLIQTDAAINPGNSGGALLNMNGELIGINSVKVSSSSVEGMGYAIPISDVQSIIEELMTKETRDVVPESAQGYLGIGGTDVTSEISETYGMPVGIFINTIYDNSPAKAAGLAKGNIITKFDGQTVKSMSELKSLLTYYKSGETVEIVAMIQGTDGYTEKTFSLTLTGKDIFGDDATSESYEDSNDEYDNGYDGNQYFSPFDSFWSIP